MRIGKFDLDQFCPDTNLQTAVSAAVFGGTGFLLGLGGATPLVSFGAATASLGAAWLLRQATTSWKRDNCLLASDLGDIDTRDHAHVNTEITAVLANYGLADAKHYKSLSGPVLTRHLISLPNGTKLGKLPTSDIARDLGVPVVSIEANAGRGLIGVDVPRPDRQLVPFAPLLESAEWKNRDPSWRLPFCPGVDQFGNPVVANLSKTPHLVVAGTTDSGKSVFVNAIILSMMESGADVRFLIADGKGVDFAKPYAKSRCLLTDTVDITSFVGEKEVIIPAPTAIETEVDGIRHQVRWLAAEMDRRYKDADYPFDIVFVCDELADITLQDDKEKTVTTTLARLAQKGRGARIHLIMITQYPTSEVLHQLVAANTPSRAGLMVRKEHESRVIIGDGGCEELLGFGDCIIALAGQKPRRVHGANITEIELKEYMK